MVWVTLYGDKGYTSSVNEQELYWNWCAGGNHVSLDSPAGLLLCVFSNLEREGWLPIAHTLFL